MTSSLFWTNTGIFLQPGDFNNRCNNFRVSAQTHRALQELMCEQLFTAGGGGGVVKIFTTFFSE